MGDLNDPFMRNQNATVQARTKVQNRSNVLQFKLVQLVTDKQTNKPRGYACIEYLNTRDMKGAGL